MLLVFLFGAAVGVGACCVHGFLMDKRLKWMREEQKRVLDENDMLKSENHRYEVERSFRQGYDDGRNDPKRDVELLAETLTQTGNGVVRFARKRAGG